MKTTMWRKKVKWESGERKRNDKVERDIIMSKWMRMWRNWY